MTGHRHGLADDSPRVMGVDACKKGWVAVADDLRAYFGRTIRELVAAADEDGPLAVIAVDIPIGLPLHGPRQADALVRALLGKRASSVFTTPVRAALAATTHAEASAITREATGKGLSQQAYALRAKILQVDQWAQVTPHRVVEVHPEVLFRGNGRANAEISEVHLGRRGGASGDSGQGRHCCTRRDRAGRRSGGHGRRLRCRSRNVDRAARASWSSGFSSCCPRILRGRTRGRNLGVSQRRFVMPDHRR